MVLYIFKCRVREPLPWPWLNVCKQQVNDYIVIGQILSKVGCLILSGLPIKGLFVFPSAGIVQWCFTVESTSNSVRLKLVVRRSSVCVQILYNLDLLFTIKTVELKICWNICGHIMAISISLFLQILNHQTTSEREIRNSLTCGKGIQLKVHCRLVVCSCYVSTRYSFSSRKFRAHFYQLYIISDWYSERDWLAK